MPLLSECNGVGNNGNGRVIAVIEGATVAVKFRTLSMIHLNQLVDVKNLH